MVRTKLNEQEYSLEEKRYDFMYSVLQNKIRTQIDSFDSLQNKINNLFGFTAVIVGGYISLIYQKFIVFSSNMLVISLNLLGIIGLMLVMALLYKSVKTRIFLDPPDTETIYSEIAFKKNLGDLKNQVLADIKESYEQTLLKLKDIAYWYDLSLITIIASILLIVVSAIIQTQCIK